MSSEPRSHMTINGHDVLELEWGLEDRTIDGEKWIYITELTGAECTNCGLEYHIDDHYLKSESQARPLTWGYLGWYMNHECR